MRLGDDELVAAVREEFAALLGVRAAPGIVEVQRWPDSMPQYSVGHLARVADIERAADSIANFKLAGAAYRGVGVPDCVRSGERAAEEVFTALTATSGRGVSGGRRGDRHERVRRRERRG